MRDDGGSFGIGFVAGLRSMTACAALAFAAAEHRTRGAFIPSGPGARGLATAAALAEIAGDKMPFAPDRRIPPSFAARLAIGAVAGTLLGRAARGAESRTSAGRARGFAEDAAAVTLAMAVVASAERQSRA
ncbi:hypothetical protein LRS73_30635 [Methylobacterium currus]|uniref:hypothetical protein n=1 Tax=Methylobacterium currus TaxID=2051553 RepID=UPI001E2BB87C|nr:hypothetical protein [Methylobacterium currus]UHC19245.1 hypothetical protein LRS73_30635 [Methylobacterium currus]